MPIGVDGLQDFHLETNKASLDENINETALGGQTNILFSKDILVQKIVWTLAGITILLWGLRIWGYITLFSWLALVATGVIAFGLLTILIAWLPTKKYKTLEIFSWIALFVTIGSLFVWGYMQVFTSPAYGTDEIAFDQYAAQLFIHGINPYLHSLRNAFNIFHVSPNGYTFKLNGHPVTALSYPALSFELYVPFLLLGWSTQLGIAVNLAAWAVSILLMFLLLPKPFRPIAIIFGSISIYVGYAIGGVTDAIFVPFLIIAAYKWDQFGTSNNKKRWAGPIAMGLAMAIKQTPWIIFPFIVSGIFLEASGRKGFQSAKKLSLQYTAVATISFLIPNLPFIVWSPMSWLKGIFTPLVSNAVPAGQGLISLTIFSGIGGGSLTDYTVASLAMLASTFAFYLATYPKLKSLNFFLPSLVLFFATRSFGSYLITLIPATLIAASTALNRFSMPNIKILKKISGVGFIGAFIALFIALTSTSPFAMSISSVHTTGQLATVDKINVLLVNNTSKYQKPTFSVNSGGILTAFWIKQGPMKLKPYEHATYTLISPNFPSMPPINGGFQVVAFTNHPGTISRTTPYLPTTWHISLTPDAINHLVKPNQNIHLQAEVLNSLNQRVRVAGLKIFLGQIVYAQKGLQYGQASINNSLPGQTPISAITNSAGVAGFNISSSYAGNHPIYFEANLVNGQYFFPYGYSQILPIRFGKL